MAGQKTRSIQKYREPIKNKANFTAEGLLSYVSESLFFYTDLSYTGRAGTTGNRKCDKFFAKIKARGHKRSLVPCMYFASWNGCLVDDCPYKHDDPTSLKHCAKLLEKRRQMLKEPTPKEHMKDVEKRVAEEGLDLDVRNAFFERLRRAFHGGNKPTPFGSPRSKLGMHYM